MLSHSFLRKKSIDHISGFLNEILCIFVAQGAAKLYVCVPKQYSIKRMNKDSFKKVESQQSGKFFLLFLEMHKNAVRHL